MNDQEILDNAPEGATHVDRDDHYWYYSPVFYWLCCDDGTTCAGDVGNNVRSLADIKRIVELENRIAELEEIALAVGHIGIDFGYGQYTLDQKTIDKARQLMNKGGEL